MTEEEKKNRFGSYVIALFQELLEGQKQCSLSSIVKSLPRRSLISNEESISDWIGLLVPSINKQFHFSKLKMCASIKMIVYAGYFWL